MKFMMKSVMLASVAAMGLSVAACDSKKENAEEAQAQDVREASDAAADAMESTAAASEDAVQAKADAVREKGDAKADAMENAADKNDKAPE